jgi:hypothetical protein
MSDLAERQPEAREDVDPDSTSSTGGSPSGASACNIRLSRAGPVHAPSRLMSVR